MCSRKLVLLLMTLFHTIAGAVGPSGPSGPSGGSGLRIPDAWIMNWRAPHLPALAPLLNRPLSPLPVLAPSVLPALAVPSILPDLAPMDVDVHSNEADAQRRLERFAEISRRLLQAELQVFSAEEAQEYRDLKNYFQSNLRTGVLPLRSDIAIEFGLIICELRCFGYIEDIIDKNTCILYLMRALDDETVKHSSAAKALYILLLILSTMPSDEIANFEEIISKVFAIFPDYREAPEDLQQLIYMGYFFLKLEHNRTLPDVIQNTVQAARKEIREKRSDLQLPPLVQNLFYIIGAKLSMNNPTSKSMLAVYSAFVPVRDKFQGNKFIDGHILELLLAPVLNEKAAVQLTEIAFRQRISAIFTAYNLENYDDFKRCLRIIMGIIDKRHPKTSLHLENAQHPARSPKEKIVLPQEIKNAQHLVRFLKEKIGLFPQEQKVLLLQDLGRISVGLLQIAVPKDYKAVDFKDVGKSVRILHELKLLPDFILGFFSDPDDYAVMIALKNVFDKELLAMDRHLLLEIEDENLAKMRQRTLLTISLDSSLEMGEESPLRMEKEIEKLRKSYISSTLLFIALNYNPCFNPPKNLKTL